MSLKNQQVCEAPVFMRAVRHGSANDERKTALIQFHASNVPDIGHMLGNVNIWPGGLAELVGAQANNLGPLILGEERW